MHKRVQKTSTISVKKSGVRKPHQTSLGPKLRDTCTSPGPLLGLKGSAKEFKKGNRVS